MKKNKKTLISTHPNPDCDALAAMLAASKLYKDATLIYFGAHRKKINEYFAKDFAFLNQNTTIKDIDIESIERLVIVDTRNKSRMSFLKSLLDKENLELHLYDHHQDSNDDLKGHFQLIEQTGSTVSILIDILAQKKISLSPAEATFMALGVYEDTGSFTFNSTTVKDYHAAAWLLKQGADLNIVADLISTEVTQEQVSLLNDLLDNIETIEIKNASFGIATSSRDNYISGLSGMADKIMEIKNLKLLFLLVEMDGKIQLVARSKIAGVNVAKIVAEFGGGGHPEAAAASIKSLTLPETKIKLEELIASALGEFYSADNLMVYPPISITENASLTKAQELLIRYGINMLLVENNEGILVGYISERNISKALFHGLKSFSVKDFMTTEFEVVHPQDDFERVKTIIVDRRQRILPVINENYQALGVITRSDLIKLIDTENTTSLKKNVFRRDINANMKNYLPQKVLNLLKKIGKFAEEKNIQIYLVGGFVRDMLLKRANSDIDLSISHGLDELINLIGQTENIVKIKQHPRFKTATLYLENGYIIDLSTSRMEYYEHPGALPVVEKGSIQLDLYRRDFTINSLAVSLNQSTFGTLVDYYSGLTDLKDKKIKVMHNLSFVEDPTRIFRAVRFEKKLNFKLSKMTAFLIENAVKYKFLSKIDKKRIFTEIKLILQEENPGDILERLNEFGALKSIDDSINFNLEMINLFKKIDKVKDWLKLSAAGDYSQSWLIYFLALTENVSYDNLEKLLSYLNINKKDYKIILLEKDYRHKILAKTKNGLLKNDLKPSEIYSLFNDLSYISILFIMAKNENIAPLGANYLTLYKTVKPFLNGNDLIKLGISRGAKIQEALEYLKLAKLDGITNGIDSEKKLIQKKYLIS